MDWDFRILFCSDLSRRVHSPARSPSELFMVREGLEARMSYKLRCRKIGFSVLPLLFRVVILRPPVAELSGIPYLKRSFQPCP